MKEKNKVECVISFNAPKEWDLDYVYRNLSQEDKDRMEGFIKGFLVNYKFSSHDHKLSFADGIKKGFLSSFCRVAG